MRRSLVFFTLFLAGHGLAQAQDNIGTPTPQYSGQAARIEHGMDRDGSPSPARTNPAEAALNDTSADIQVQSRGHRIDESMERRREESNPSRRLND